MNILELFEKIKIFVFDVDGVLTDGMLTVPEEGELLRRMNIKDGYALQLAIKKAYKIWIISGGISEAVKQRLIKLGVQEVFTGVKDKATLLKELISQHNTDVSTILYMGDDMPDAAAMQIVGLSCCPLDAAIDIKSIAHYIAPFKGGEGCVRDVIEKVMKIQNTWE